MNSIDDRTNAVATLQARIRRRFLLDADHFVSVSEFTCHLPNCPPRETLVMFWKPDRSRTVLKFHCAIADINESDVEAANP